MQAAEQYRQPGDQSKNEHVYLLLDCADICLTSAHFMQHGSPLHGYVCQACFQVCNHCAGICEQLGETDCANACRNCADSCRYMANMVAYGQ